MVLMANNDVLSRVSFGIGSGSGVTRTVLLRVSKDAVFGDAESHIVSRS